MNRFIHLFLILLISANAFSKKDRNYLLYSSNLKYWECTIEKNNIVGIIFKKNKTYIEYDGIKNYYTDLTPQDAIFKNMYSFKDNRIDFFYDGNRKNLINTWIVLRLTEDTLIIRDGTGGHTFTYLKAKEQNKQLKLPPQFRRGYQLPRLKDSCQIRAIMNYVFNRDSIICPKPLKGRILVNCDVNKNGTVSSLELQKAIPSSEKYGIFYGLVLTELKKIQFIPAMDVDSGELFSEKICIPILFDFE